MAVGTAKGRGVALVLLVLASVCVQDARAIDALTSARQVQDSLQPTNNAAHNTDHVEALKGLGAAVSGTDEGKAQAIGALAQAMARANTTHGADGAEFVKGLLEKIGGGTALLTTGTASDDDSQSLLHNGLMLLLGAAVGGGLAYMATRGDKGKASDEERKVAHHILKHTNVDANEGDRDGGDGGGVGDSVDYGECLAEFPDATKRGQCTELEGDHAVTDYFGDALADEIHLVANAFRPKSARQAMLYAGLGASVQGHGGKLNSIMKHVIRRTKAQTTFACTTQNADNPCQVQSVAETSVDMAAGLDENCVRDVVLGQSAIGGAKGRMAQLMFAFHDSDPKLFWGASPRIGAAVVVCLRVALKGKADGATLELMQRIQATGPGTQMYEGVDVSALIDRYNVDAVRDAANAQGVDLRALEEDDGGDESLMCVEPKAEMVDWLENQSCEEAMPDLPDPEPAEIDSPKPEPWAGYLAEFYEEKHAVEKLVMWGSAEQASLADSIEALAASMEKLGQTKKGEVPNEDDVEEWNKAFTSLMFAYETLVNRLKGISLQLKRPSTRDASTWVREMKARAQREAKGTKWEGKPLHKNSFYLGRLTSLLEVLFTASSLLSVRCLNNDEVTELGKSLTFDARALGETLVGIGLDCTVRGVGCLFAAFGGAVGLAVPLDGSATRAVLYTRLLSLGLKRALASKLLAKALARGVLNGVGRRVAVGAVTRGIGMAAARVAALLGGLWFGVALLAVEAAIFAWSWYTTRDCGDLVDYMKKHQDAVRSIRHFMKPHEA